MLCICCRQRSAFFQTMSRLCHIATDTCTHGKFCLQTDMNTMVDPLHTLRQRATMTSTNNAAGPLPTPLDIMATQSHVHEAAEVNIDLDREVFFDNDSM